MPPPCRLLIDPAPRSGAWNMAADEVLLQQAVAEGRSAFRWYRWKEPTLSLGYFQKFTADELAARWQSLPVVRRLSGGGAILHDVEWTYSCAFPAGHRWSHNPRELYLAIHAEIIAVLAELQLPVGYRGEQQVADPQAFLCFQRGESFDLVCGDKKVLGSAQRRRMGAILQHGSLVCRTSAAAPEIPGLLDLASPQVEGLFPKIGQNLQRTVANRLLKEPLTAGNWTDDELGAIEALLPQYQLQFSNRPAPV